MSDPHLPSSSKSRPWAPSKLVSTWYCPFCLPNPVGGGVSVRRGLCSPILSKGGVDPSKGWNMVGTQHLAGEQMTPP